MCGWRLSTMASWSTASCDAKDARGLLTLNRQTRGYSCSKVKVKVNHGTAWAQDKLRAQVTASISRSITSKWLQTGPFVRLSHEPPLCQLVLERSLSSCQQATCQSVRPSTRRHVLAHMLAHGRWHAQTRFTHAARVPSKRTETVELQGTAGTIESTVPGIVMCSGAPPTYQRYQKGAANKPARAKIGEWLRALLCRAQRVPATRDGSPQRVQSSFVLVCWGREGVSQGINNHQSSAHASA